MCVCTGFRKMWKCTRRDPARKIHEREDGLFLKALQIRGFKSFARKTVLEFEPGVTIIVGPNGSGKSNIADAVMWVLGEQSPTSLRGSRMEDVIFAGSSSQRPVNMAEVQLVLDNASSDFPLDYSEVTITRNVVRGGDSEYRLNNSSCRLLDIQEMLSDAGVGRALNAVISQGQLEEVLACRPEERRDYIEEAGGLLKYRRRREKALRRLGRMDEELLRLDDVMREVRRQLRPLVRQAGRLEQYQSLSRELSQARLRLDVARLRMMQKEWKEHQDLQSGRQEKIAALDAEISSMTAEVEALEGTEERWRVAEAGQRDALYRLVSLHEQLKARLPVWEEKRKLLEARNARVVDPAELEEVGHLNVAREERRSGVLAGLEEARGREDLCAAETKRLSAALEEVARGAAALEARLELLGTPAAVGGAAAALRAADLAAELERTTAERDRLSGELILLEGEASRREEGVREMRAESRALAARTGELLAHAGSLEVEQAALVTRLDILSRLDTEGWTTLNTSGALLREDPTEGALGGMLVNSLKIDRRYERAIMGFLGPWAFGLLARDAGAIRTAIRYLKERRLGQSLFLLQSRGGPVPEAAEPTVVPEGSVRARDLVEAPGRFAGALDALLDGVFVVDGIEEAFDLAGRYPGQVFLSPEGDVVSGGTLVKGGSADVNPVHLELNRTRREELEGSLDRTRRKLESVELDLAGCRAREAGLGGLIEAGAEKALGARAELAERSGQMSAASARLELLTGELEWATAEAGGGAAQPADLRSEEARLEELRARGRSLTDELRLARDAHGAAQSESRSLEAQLAGLDLELEAGRAREEHLRLAVERAAARVVGGAVKGGGDLARLESLHERLIEQVRGAREKVRDGMDSGSAAVRADMAKLRSVREEMLGRKRLHDALREDLHGEDLSRAELKLRVEQLVDGIVDGHKVPLEFALNQYPDELPTPELERAVERLSARMEHIGPVNPEAITERQALEERYDFLKGQLDDIDKSRSQLRRVVREVDREMRDKFVETTEEVDRHFREIFSLLFPKGSAEIRLTDPGDPLNSGVEIYAQPEGKKLRRISLMSGGETSLAALAFFFALFKVRPSPFYFLDEVEAALDDVNLHRFLELVKKFKDESQLILITHQKRSMEIADILYGISMQDDGVSRVVSQKVAG